MIQVVDCIPVKECLSVIQVVDCTPVKECLSVIQVVDCLSDKGMLVCDSSGRLYW